MQTEWEGVGGSVALWKYVTTLQMIFVQFPFPIVCFATAVDYKLATLGTFRHRKVIEHYGNAKYLSTRRKQLRLYRQLFYSDTTAITIRFVEEAFRSVSHSYDISAFI